MGRQKGNTGVSCPFCKEYMIRIYERKDGRFVPIGYSCLTDHIIRYDDEVQAIQEEMKKEEGGNT